MDWRSIENDPPEMEQTVYATDGKGMWVGQIIRGYEEPLLDGLCLENGHAVCIPLCVFTEWKPAQAAFRERKSADEMFRELGYRKIRETALHTTYENDTGERIHLKFPGGRRWKNMMAVATSPNEFLRPEMTSGEILACARLIEEMEESE